MIFSIFSILRRNLSRIKKEGSSDCKQQIFEVDIIEKQNSLQWKVLLTLVIVFLSSATIILSLWLWPFSKPWLWLWIRLEAPFFRLKPWARIRKARAIVKQPLEPNPKPNPVVSKRAYEGGTKQIENNIKVQAWNFSADVLCFVLFLSCVLKNWRKKRVQSLAVSCTSLFLLSDCNCVAVFKMLFANFQNGLRILCRL